MLVVTLVVCIVGLLYVYYKWAFSFWRRKNVVQVQASIPFGSAGKIIRRQTTFGELIREIYEEYKPRQLRYVGFYLFSKPILIVLDIDLIKTILTTDFQHFTDHGNYINEVREPLTGHLFGLKGHKWRNLRAKLTPTFTSGKMKMMFRTLLDCSDGLKNVLDEMIEQQEPIEIRDVVARYTTDVIGSCAFGLDCNSLKNPNSEFRKYGKRIFEIDAFESFVRALALVSPWAVDALRLKFVNQEITDFISNVVKDTIQYREQNDVKRDDFMHLLIQLKNNIQIKDDEHVQHLKNADTSKTVNAEGLTIEEISAQAFVFFVAGFETSSTTLTFCFFELVSNQGIQDKLREEIQTVLSKHHHTITYDSLSEMTYMDKCIQETLRKYPPLPLLFRECTEDYTIPESNIHIKKGMQIFLPTLGIHHDPEFYPNPERFDPERFNTENKASRNHFAWLPFGEGPRACIGLRFGLMQIKVALTVLLKDYEFTLSDKTQTPLSMKSGTIITTAEGGIWLNVKKLSH